MNFPPPAGPLHPPVRAPCMLGAAACRPSAYATHLRLRLGAVAPGDCASARPRFARQRMAQSLPNPGSKEPATR